MTLAATLQAFQASVQQVDTLIANAHRTDGAGAPLFPSLDQQQITIGAFLNLFVAWETFLESSLVKLMTGLATVSGNTPNRYVSPPSLDAAHAMVIGINKYFDFANVEFVRKIVSLFFENGYPFEPHISAIAKDLLDLRAMRNASAHVTTTTQKALDALAQRLLGTPHPGIGLYQILTTQMPGAVAGGTVLSEYRDRLLVAAGLITQG